MSNVIDSFRGEYSIFSNLNECIINFGGLEFRNSEACFQAQKCTTDEEKLAFCKITGVEAKHLGRKVKMDVNKWNTIKYAVMYAVVQEKFKQSDKFRQKLMDTEGMMLIEGNDHGDAYWGVCNKTKQGKNKLGEILMTIRDRYINDTAMHNIHNEIYANMLQIPIDSVILGLKKGRFKYEPCVSVNYDTIYEIAMNPRTSTFLRMTAVFEKDENGTVIGTTIVEGNDIATALVKLDCISAEALYGNMMYFIRTTREAYEHFKSLNFKF